MNFISGNKILVVTESEANDDSDAAVQKVINKIITKEELRKKKEFEMYG
jgi:hypothetical protein